MTCQRWRTGRATYRPAGEPIATRDYEVAAIPDDRTAKTFVLEHHCAASYPAARYRFGLYRGAELAGVAVFSQPARPEVLRPLPGDPKASVDLGRFVLLDAVPANGETWFLARCFELLRREAIVGVVSFSDPVPRADAAGAVTFRGHVGCIYQAHNAVYLGRTRADWMRLLPDGTSLHNRALAKARARDRGWRYVVELLERYGAAPAPRVADLGPWLDVWVPRLTRRVRHAGNHKFAWGLDRAAKRGLLANVRALVDDGRLPDVRPFPKTVDGELPRAA